MKRSLLFLAVLSLAIAVSAGAQQTTQSMQDFTGQTWVTGNLGYAFGMGDAFADYTEPYTNVEYSSDAGIGFGGQFYYGLKYNLLIGGELLFQSYTFKMTVPANLALGVPQSSVSHSETEANLLINSLYGLNQTRTSALFLMGGTGFYDFGGTKMGLNTGLLWRKQVSDNWYLFGMPRVHFVLTDNTPMMIQLTMGAQFNIG